VFQPASLTQRKTFSTAGRIGRNDDQIRVSGFRPTEEIDKRHLRPSAEQRECVSRCDGDTESVDPVATSLQDSNSVYCIDGFIEISQRMEQHLTGVEIESGIYAQGGRMEENHSDKGSLRILDSFSPWALRC